MTPVEFVSIFFVALSLSADCFAVALGGSVSVRKLRDFHVFRTALAFGIAQAVMPVIGWVIGHTVVDYVASYAHWVVFGLLAIVGGRMIREAFRDQNEGKESADISRGFLLVSLAVATSIDSLAVGLSFGVLETSIVYASLIIGLVAFLITVLGFYVGRKAGGLLGKRARIIGGIILIGIGLRVLLTGLPGG